MIEKVFFLYCAFACVVSAGMMISRSNLLHGVLWMLTFFIHVAGIFLLLNAEFIAALQIMVYAGAILVLYLFLIMLLNVQGLAAQRPRAIVFDIMFSEPDRFRPESDRAFVEAVTAHPNTWFPLLRLDPKDDLLRPRIQSR